MSAQVVTYTADHLVEAEKLALLLAEEALEKKAEAPALLDASGLSAYADYFLLLSASNERQVKAIADAIERRAREEGCRPLGVEGENGSRWILIDLGQIIVHIFHEDARYHYDLDGLWADARAVEIPGAPLPSSF